MKNNMRMIAVCERCSVLVDDFVFDICGCGMLTKKMLKNRLRLKGCSVGKRLLCPDCKGKKGR